MRRVALLLVLAIAAAPAAEAAPSPAAKRCTVAKKHAAKKRTKKARHAARRACARKKQAPVVAAPAPSGAAVMPVAEQPTAPDVPAVVPTVPVDAPVVVPAPAPVVTLLRTVGITQREFSLSLSRTTVGSGDVTIQVNNRGEDPHDLRLEDSGGTELSFWEELDPFGSATRVVALTAGSYRVYCTLPGHAEAGMDTRLTVLD